MWLACMHYLATTAHTPRQEGVDYVIDGHMANVITPVYQWRSTRWSGDEVWEERIVPVASSTTGKFADGATVIGTLDL